MVKAKTWKYKIFENTPTNPERSLNPEMITDKTGNSKNNAMIMIGVSIAATLRVLLVIVFIAIFRQQLE